MGADVDGDNFIIFDDEFYRHAIADIDGDGVQACQAAFQGMQAQGRVMWIQLKQL